MLSERARPVGTRGGFLPVSHPLCRATRTDRSHAVFATRGLLQSSYGVTVRAYAAQRAVARAALPAVRKENHRIAVAVSNASDTQSSAALYARLYTVLHTHPVGAGGHPADAAYPKSA